MRLLVLVGLLPIVFAAEEVRMSNALLALHPCVGGAADARCPTPLITRPYVSIAGLSPPRCG